MVINQIKKNDEKVSLFSLQQKFENWDIGNLLQRIKLVSYSINNIRSLALILNGIPGDKVIFQYPDDLKDFDILSNVKYDIKRGSFDVQVKELYSCKLEDVISFYNEKIHFE